MNNCKALGVVTQQFIPDIFEKVDWNGVWNRKLENGSAFEWAVLAALIKAARENDIEVSIPLIDVYNAGNFFILRNEIPLSHGAQAGNSATALSSKKLKDRFLYSLVPKAIFKIDNVSYSVFREGCPYHKIMSGKNYLERTDIIFVPGLPDKEFPKLNSSSTEVLFSYRYHSNQISGNLRIINSPLIPCKSRFPRGGMEIVPQGIIECSINKTEDVASFQLSRYDELFSTEESRPIFSLITGNDLSHLPFDTHTIDLSTEDTDSLYQELLFAAKNILENFSIIVQ